MQTATCEPAKATCLDPLNVVAATIKARVAKGDKATTDADGHYKAAGLLLLEAKRRLPVEQPGKQFTAYIVGECRLGTTRANELIAVAEGRTTVEAQRAKGRDRAARHAAKNKAARGNVTNVSHPLAEQRDIVMAAMKDASLADWKRLAKCATDIKSARDIIKDKADRAETRAQATVH